MLTRASEITVFGLKSTKKSTKVVKKRWRICSGTGGREFESRHFDQKKRTAPCEWFSFLSKRCYDSNLSCVVRCEFAFSAQSAASLLVSGKRENIHLWRKSRHFDQKKRTAPCEWFSFLSKRCYDSNLSCVVRCEFAFSAQSAASLLVSGKRENIHLWRKSRHFDQKTAENKLF